MTAYRIDINSVIQMTDNQFYRLCRANPELRFERNPRGDLIIMSPTGGETGNYNFEVVVDLGIWNRQAQRGKAFDSSTGFKLPNGANRSPDVAWIQNDRWEALTPEQQQKFPPICPDFVIEIRSPSDDLSSLQEKMREYIENGTQLGWLIDRPDRQVEVYRSGQPVEILEAPTSLSGESVLPGFVLPLTWPIATQEAC